jgi:hypothetical protein
LWGPGGTRTCKQTIAMILHCGTARPSSET